MTHKLVDLVDQGAVPDYVGFGAAVQTAAVPPPHLAEVPRGHGAVAGSPRIRPTAPRTTDTSAVVDLGLVSVDFFLGMV